MSLFFGVFFSFLVRSAVVEFPENCLRKTPKSCVFRFLKDGKIEQPSGKIYALKGATVLFRQDLGYSLLEGKILVLARKPFALSHLGHKILVKGEVLVEKASENKLNLINLDAEVQASSHNYNEELPAGLQNWYAPAQEVVNRGYVKALDVDKVLSLLNKIWSTSSSLKKDRFKSYQTLWKNRIEESSAFYREVAFRIEEKNSRKRLNAENRQQQKKMLDMQMRKSFRQLHFVE
jgi:hypothetical protein